MARPDDSRSPTGGRGPSLLPWLLTAGLMASTAPAQTDGELNRLRVRTEQTRHAANVVFELDRRTDYEVRTAGRRVYLELFEGPYEVTLPERGARSDLLERVGYRELEEGVQIYMDAGSSFRDAEHFELDHPFRIVVQLNAEYAPEPPPAPEPIAVDPRSEPEGVVFRAEPTDVDEPLPSEPSPSSPLPLGEPRRGLQTIVIDAGHGGEETGAQGPAGTYEKDVTLDISIRLASKLRSRLGLEVVMTREIDRTLGLDERAATANHAGGQLFISIHANAARDSSAAGAETYFLSYRATDDEARLAAARENSSVGVNAELAPPGSGIEFLLWDMAQSQFLEQSSRLAESIQRELNRTLGLRDRGIKQAPFKVLMGVAIPAVLVEVGFLSNPDEELQLTQDRHQEQLVEALYRSIRRFKDETERRLGVGSVGAAQGGR